MDVDVMMLTTTSIFVNMFPMTTVHGLSAQDAEEVAGLLKALADPVRLRLWTRIAANGQESCVCEIEDLGVSQPTVSHHLRRLREAGLVEAERRGTWVYYRAVPGALDPVRALGIPVGEPAAQ
jgi:ArsR family transcriptional regulator, arsenate/arsenite/antimonite-responsive transcriptional repressor